MSPDVGLIRGREDWTRRSQRGWCHASCAGEMLSGRCSTQLLLVVALGAGLAPAPTLADMRYSEPMRLQNPPQSIATPELKCSVCVVSCDAIQHELQQVKKWTESKIMEAFEGAVALLGDQYGYSDAEGIPQYIQRGRIPVATGLKIRTEYQDIVEALSGEFEDEMLASYQNDFRSFRNEFCVTRNKVCKADAPQLNAPVYKPEGY